MRRPKRTPRLRTLSLERCEPRWLPSTLTVTSATDGAAGSLRTTIASAAAGDTIRFASKLKGASLSLTLGELAINKSLTILGSGQTLNAGGNSRVLEVDGPGTSVILSQLTITGGRAGLLTTPAPAYAGGGIAVIDASLTLRNSLITGNQAIGSPGGTGVSAISAQGGGIFAFESQISLTNTSIIGNESLGGQDSLTEQAGAGGGGGLFLEASSAVVNGGRIQGNLAQGGDAVNPITAFPSSNGGAGDGGGILLLGSNLSLSRVQISGNSAKGGKGLPGALAPVEQPMAGPGIGGTAAGGAIFTEGAAQGSSTSTLSIAFSSLTNNLAQGGPAGMAANASQAAVPGGLTIGGAIEQLNDTTLVLKNTQVIGNLAKGGIAAANIPDGGADTSSGGEAFGGAIDSEFFTRISASQVTFRGNTAQGVQGGNSAPGSGTEAGVGGPAQGGAWNLRNTGGITPSAPLPVTITNSTFTNNQALAGSGGTGTQPADNQGTGGYATGGALQTNGIYQLTISGTSWINNKAVAQQGQFAFGGAIGMSFGFKTSQTTITRNLFLGNLARGGDDPVTESLRTSSGGAILNNDPNTTISQTTFINNTAQAGNATGIGVPGNAKGGAVDTTGPNATLTLTSDKLIGNRALGGLVLGANQLIESDSGLASGGAVYLEGGQLTASKDQFSGNLALSKLQGTFGAGFAGALYVSAGTIAQLSKSSFTGNTVQASGGDNALGGAIANFSDNFSDTGSTYTGNQAIVQGTGSAFGGALFIDNTSSLTGSKITRNAAIGRGQAQGFGGGIAFDDNPKVVLQGVVVQKNRATTSGNNLFGDYQSS